MKQSSYKREKGFCTSQLTFRIALLVAAATTFGTAQAQSVSLYGVVDTGIEYVSNIGPSRSDSFRIPTITGSVPSRWGLRGKEDLGGGTSAVFVLESGFGVDQGTLNQGGRLFGRQAYAGLSGSWGTLTVGRQYSQIYWALIGDTMGPNIFAAADLDTYLANSRVDNAIAYSGKFGAFAAGITYSLGRDAVLPAAAGGCAGESPTDWKACKAFSAMLKYDTGSWGLATAFDRNFGGAGAGSPLPASSQTDTRILVNGYAKYGIAAFGGGLVHRKNEGAPFPTSNYWFAGVTVSPTAQIDLDLQYGLLRVRSSPAGASLVALRAMYNLSKRTAVYVTAGRIFNQEKSTLTIDGGNLPTSNTPLPGVGQTGAMVGVRHVF
ncbi:porin [Cupriavidus basilensis]|uniref:porin n=1 Tax=Cupriavidus basilensis TaxID=68895 RepID=UPI000695CF24|nr:porin [Cupriavidus basilensis]